MSKDLNDLSRIVMAGGMRRRELLITLGTGALGLAVAFFLKGCNRSQSSEGGGGGVPAAPPAGLSNFTIMTNSSDPLLVTAKTSDGRMVEFFGTRDVSGKPTVVDQIFIRSDNGDAIRYDLDSTGRPTKMIAIGGTQFLLNWTSSTTAAVTVISSDGTAQVNTTVNFVPALNNAAGGLSEVAPTATTTQKNGSAPRGGRRIALQFSPPQTGSIQTDADTNALAGTILAAQGVGVCTVRVTSCDLPEENAEVYVFVNTDGPSKKFLGQFRASRVSAGIYQATIPTNLAPSINPSAICESLAGALGNACTLQKLAGGALALCTQISIAVAITGIGTLVAGEIEVACLAVTGGLTLYCISLGASPAPGGPKLVDVLCKADVLNRTFVDDILLSPNVACLPTTCVGGTRQAPGQGPYPDLSVNLGSNTHVRSLTLNPPSPSAKQAYIGTADISCLPTGTTVTMSIVGTDEYQDETSITVPSAQRNGTFTLSVPGAEESGILDTVTVLVKRPDGQSITRTASLVFG